MTTWLELNTVFGARFTDAAATQLRIETMLATVQNNNGANPAVVAGDITPDDVADYLAGHILRDLKRSERAVAALVAQTGLPGAL